MERHHLFVVIGLVLAIIGGIVVAATFMTVFPDPSEKAEWEEEYGLLGGSEDAVLERGEYDVWVSDSFGDVRVRIRDGSEVIFDESSNDHSENIDINGKTYYRLGTFEVEGGTYDVETDGQIEVYITPPLDVWGALGTVCAAGIIVIVGIIFLVVGVIMWLIKPNKGAERPPQRGPPPYGRDPYRDAPEGYRDPYREDYRPPGGEYPVQDEYRRDRRPPPRRYNR